MVVEYKQVDKNSYRVDIESKVNHRYKGLAKSAHKTKSDQIKAVQGINLPTVDSKQLKLSL